MLPTTPKRRPSLLKQQLSILNIEPGAPEASAAERLRMQGVELAPLNLSGRQRSRRLAPTLFSLAAAVAVLVVGYRLLSPSSLPEEGLRVKGASKVSLYWERDGVVEPWDNGVVLQNGDRVRAEVLAGSDAAAYLAVVSGDGTLLSDPSQVSQGAVRLQTGERQAFPGSIKLVGADERERLAVVICQTDGGGFPDLGQVFVARGQKLNLQNLPGECAVEQFSLRGHAGRP